MRDIIHTTLKFIDHNRYAVTAVVLAAVLMAASVACQPTTTSPFTGEQVTRTELMTEVERQRQDLEVRLAGLRSEAEAIQARAEGLEGITAPALEDLERKEAAIQRALEALDQLARDHGGPAAGTIVSVLGAVGLLIGGGAVADNRRKDRVIRDLKEGRADGE